MHRYIPVLARMLVLEIGEKRCKPKARKYGETKFRWNVCKRFSGFNYHLVPFSFWKRPMHFLAPWDPMMFIIGFMLAVYIRYFKILHMYNICATAW
jgi:hypothetical protein